MARWLQPIPCSGGHHEGEAMLGRSESAEVVAHAEERRGPAVLITYSCGSESVDN
jgi:hypothetical protein